jgi:hypothetical protein
MAKTNEIEGGIMYVNLPVNFPDIFAGSDVKKLIWQGECHYLLKNESAQGKNAGRIFS